MKEANSTNSQGSPRSAAPQDMGFTPWQRLKTKRICYLTLPLILMATVMEYVILATGWKYQQLVCLPQGMGVTFFGIGPIGATMLAVELLKLLLAIWTASRQGWRKGFMLIIGLPLDRKSTRLNSSHGYISYAVFCLKKKKKKCKTTYNYILDNQNPNHLQLYTI